MSLKVMKFSADWCSPCKTLHPIWDKISTYDVDDVEFVEVDIDESPELASRYGITSIPTMLFMKDNVVVNKLVGLYPEAVIVKALEDLRGE